MSHVPATDPSILRDLLIARASSDPDAPAFDDGRRRVTYGELAEAAAGKAALLASLGVRPGDRVALVMSAGVSWAEAFWGAQLMGVATAAFNPRLPASTLERQTARIRPRLVLTDDSLDGALAAELPPEPPIGPDDLAFLQPTSGTSGEPRAAMLLHRNVLAYLRADNYEWAHRGDVFVAWVPPWHDMGLVRFMIGGVAHCVECHIVQPAVSTIPLFLETIGRVGGTLIAAPDFAYRLAPKMVKRSAVDITSLRSAGNGGEPVNSSSVERFEEAFGLSGVVQPGYGLAEATLGVSMHPAGEPLIVDEHGHVSNGPLRDGIEARIDGDPDAPGEILLRGDAMFAGYFDAPDDTALALRNGWLYTGDIGYLDDGGRLYVLGRSRAMIKRAGGVVAPRELEEASQSVPGVRLAAAVGMPDAAGLTETALLVVEDERAGSEDEPAVAGEVSRAVVAAAGFAPGRVIVLPPRSIPRTPSGKVRHVQLREMLLSAAA
jgi:acyl-CoA synthetase (AMP-forming)/AMP-acid ligase II